MKKLFFKNVIPLFSVVLMVGLAISLSACGHEHVYGEWRETAKATCTYGGLFMRFCECGNVEQKSGSPLGHDISTEWTVDVEPTCTTLGSKSHHCIRCTGYREDTTEIPTIDHICVIDNEVAPTCIKGGLTEGKHCAVCNEIIVSQTSIMPLGHITVIDKAVPATCTEAGLTEGKHCEVCGTVIAEQEILPERGHRFGSWTIASEPSSAGECLQERACDCGEKETKLFFSDGLEYTLNADGDSYSVTGKGNCFGSFGTISIPPEHNGLPVVSIGDGAFAWDDLAIIFIPNSVTSIGTRAFSDCNNLKSVFIPDSVTSIGDKAFYNCNKLVKIRVPDGVTSIDPYTFAYCNSLESIALSKNITSIGDHAFYACFSLTSITLGKSVASIGNSAFELCHQLVEVYNLSPSLIISQGRLGNGDVGRYALDVYTSIDSPSKLWMDANGYVFYEDGNICYLLSYTGIEEDLILPDSCNGKNYEIYEYTFYMSSSLKRIKSVKISNSVTSIHENAFGACSNLIIYITDIGAWLKMSSDSDHVYPSGHGTKSILDDSGKEVTELVIPNVVTGIGEDTFISFASLISVIIPDGIMWIGDNAFSSCRNLIHVAIGDSVMSIGHSAFSGCSALTSVTIGNGVTSIDHAAFQGCDSLTSITIPNSVTSIGFYAFSDCNSLVNITISSNVISIASCAFYDCGSLTSITIPDSVTSIDEQAFYKCSGLISITIPESVTSIGRIAFAYCKSLVSITIGNRVASIGREALRGCNSLTSITFEGTIEEWKAITLGDNWNLGVPATEIICYDGVVSLN